MAVRARGSTGCTTISSSSAMLPDVRLEFDRSLLTELPPVCVRCILRFDEAMLPRCRTDAYINVSHHNCRFQRLHSLLAVCAACQR